ncbi:MAG TPA: TetR/AcrR family transcriptional regulator [Rhizorhapis sp.]
MHSAKKSRRVDGVATREQLMITAERLFARRGYAGVSLAEIGAAAGQSNKMVVPYYFGSKDGLIDAIFERRIEWLEERRKQGIDAATLEGELDLRTALDLLYRPIAEIELDGERVYARFLLQFLLQFDSWEGKQHPIERGLASGATRHIIQTIDGHLPNLPPHHFANRCAFFFLGAVVDWENQRAAGRCVEDISQVIDQSLDFIITGLIGMNAHAGVLQ